MKIVVDDHAGVCSGVRRAIRMVEENLERDVNLAALGPLIHNQKEITRLESKGLVTIDQQDLQNQAVDLPSLATKKILIRTHGIGLDLRSKLTASESEIIDATCPTVRRVQKLIKEHYENGYQILIVGRSGHPEVQGLQGHCEGSAVIIRSDSDLDSVQTDRKTFLVAQTTISPYIFTRIYRKLRNRIDELKVKDTTCRQINRRQDYLKAFAKFCDVVLVVGGKNSSNTRFLADLCRSENERTFQIEDEREIMTDWLNESDTIGITGGASTPRWQLYDVKDFIENNVLSRH